MECECDVDFRCDYCPSDPTAKELGRVLRITPNRFDAHDAYDNEYKGQFVGGWH